jgi:hypothetical protein
MMKKRVVNLNVKVLASRGGLTILV